MADAYVLVLILVAGLDLVFPARLVALGPFGVAVGERRVVPRQRVGLALVRALLVGDLLRLLPAARKRDEPERRDEGNDGARAHDLLPAAGCAPPLGGP